MNSEVHFFVAADQDYPKIADIHAEWMRLSGNLGCVRYEFCSAACRGRRSLIFVNIVRI